MFKRALIFFLGLIALISLMACQKTPEKEVVLGKDLDRVLDEAQNTEGKPQGTTLREKLDIPETYTASLQDAKGNLQVNVNADFNLSDTDKLPTAKVGMDTFSQETADKLMKALLQGQTLYDLESYLQESKADIQERLMELYAMRAGTIPIDLDGEDTDLDETIKVWEKQLESAPEEIVKTPAQTTFYKKTLPGIDPFDCIEGAAEVGGRPAYFSVQNWTQENRVRAEFYNSETMSLNGRKYERLDVIKSKLDYDFANVQPKITAEEAQEQADGLIENLGLSYLNCACAEIGINLEGSASREDGTPDFSTAKTAYIFQYVRKVSGIPITYTGDDGNQVESEENYAKPWPYETITVVIDDAGIIEFQWVSPYTEPEIVTEDTKLLSFPEIQQIFEKMIVVKNSWNEDTTVQIDIDAIQLGLMRITDPDQRNSGILIPVWDFFGTRTHKNGTEQSSNPRDSLLTINAVDGTVIDRGLGY